MTKHLRHACLVALLLGAAAQAAEGDISKLAWLTGCWKSESSETGSLEQWMAPAGGTMLGMSRTVKNGVTLAFEFMQIRSTAGRSLEFVAKPSGQDEATFTLSSLSDTEAVFENPQHDFPQRIVYRLDRGKLRARIEGKRNGAIRAVEFPMARVQCADPKPAQLPP
jgi:hypothetical protein